MTHLDPFQTEQFIANSGDPQVAELIANSSLGAPGMDELAARSEREHPGLAERVLARIDPTARIWSNTHGKWWAPNSDGYTSVYELAGRYPIDEARAIVKVATAGGTRTIRAAGKHIHVAPEILIPETPA